jgi:hypothetical protein
MSKSLTKAALRNRTRTNNDGTRGNLCLNQIPIIQTTLNGPKLREADLNLTPCLCIAHERRDLKIGMAARQLFENLPTDVARGPETLHSTDQPDFQ